MKNKSDKSREETLDPEDWGAEDGPDDDEDGDEPTGPPAVVEPVTQSPGPPAAAEPVAQPP